MKAIYKNLKDQTGMTSPRDMMLCFLCQAEYSANRGDYFMVDDPNHKFKCCDETMDLVYKIEKISKR